jgi:hypothetical protein
MSSKLKAITTKAKALYKTGKYAKWTDAIKAASKSLTKKTSSKKIGAIKKKATKKVVKRKIATKKKSVKKSPVRNYGSHKDTKSHNVRISVVSGITKDLENKLKEAIRFVGIYKSNIDFEKLMIKKEPAKKNYWKLKVKDSEKKLKIVNQIVSKLKKAY